MFWGNRLVFKVIRQLLIGCGEYLRQPNDKLWVCDEERTQRLAISCILIFIRNFLRLTSSQRDMVSCL